MRWRSLRSLRMRPCPSILRADERIVILPVRHDYNWPSERLPEPVSTDPADEGMSEWAHA